MEAGMIIDTLYGFKIKIDPIADLGVERSLYLNGSYEEGTLHVIGKVLNQGDTFVDVGANIGLMSLYVSHLFQGKCMVLAFEPNPKTRSILEDNVKLNNFQNIEIESFAVGLERKATKIYDRWDINRGGSSLIKPEEETDSYNIDEISLDEYFSDNTEIKLIKIDIEGYELNALRGARQILGHQNAPMLIIEYSEAMGNKQPGDSHLIYEFLLSLNHYRIFKSQLSKTVAAELVEVHSKAELPIEDNIYCFTNNHLANIPKEIFEKSTNLK